MESLTDPLTLWLGESDRVGVTNGERLPERLSDPVKDAVDEGVIEAVYVAVVLNQPVALSERDGDLLELGEKETDSVALSESLFEPVVLSVDVGDREGLPERYKVAVVVIDPDEVELAETVQVREPEADLDRDRVAVAVVVTDGLLETGGLELRLRVEVVVPVLEIVRVMEGLGCVDLLTLPVTDTLCDTVVLSDPVEVIEALIDPVGVRGSDAESVLLNEVDEESDDGGVKVSDSGALSEGETVPLREHVRDPVKECDPLSETDDVHTPELDVVVVFDQLTDPEMESLTEPLTLWLGESDVVGVTNAERLPDRLSDPVKDAVDEGVIDAVYVAVVLNRPVALSEMDGDPLELLEGDADSVALSESLFEPVVLSVDVGDREGLPERYKVAVVVIDPDKLELVEAVRDREPEADLE